MPDPQKPDERKPRTYAAAHFALELDGKKDVGLFRSIEGGGVKADVMTYQKGGDYERWRQIGKQKYEDIKLQVGMSMSEPFYKWIENFFTGIPDRKSGAIVAADFYYKARARRTFTEALIKELTFPALKADDKNAAYMNIALAVEDIVFSAGDGNVLSQVKGMQDQKYWKANNFRFVLDGFETACKRTAKVDAFTIKQNIMEHNVGGRQSAIKVPSAVEFPNLVFYVPEVDAEPLIKHFNDYAMKTVREQRGHGPKKTGSLVTFDNGKQTHFTLEFFETEIISITPEKSDATSEEVKLVKVELFTERMTFKYGKG
jgi:phage tail-like protein